VLAAVVVAGALLVAIQLVLSPPLWVGVGLVVASWLVLVLAHRDLLDVGGTFPEVRRVPLLGALIAGPGRFRVGPRPSAEGDPP
jgi:hypothetical protein